MIGKAIDHNRLALESARSYYVADHAGVNRHEFHTFVQPFFAQMAGLQALEWVPRMSAADRDQFEAAVRREGFGISKSRRKAPTGASDEPHGGRNTSPFVMSSHTAETNRLWVMTWVPLQNGGRPSTGPAASARSACRCR